MALKNNYEGKLKKIENGYYYKCVGKETIQIMAVADLEVKEHINRIKNLLPERIELIYSDPPWNPGNRKYWRTHANKDHDGSYNDFLTKWTDLVNYCIENKETSHVFTEQSYNDEHREMFLEHADKWALPLRDKYKVFYGSPGSRSRQNPNMLLHFSKIPLRTNPTGLDGEVMTIRACAGTNIDSGATVLDPCMGKGMTSRMALYFQWNCIGTELNSKRLGKAITWLERHNFEVSEEEL
jgi:hypothetical protein